MEFYEIVDEKITDLLNPENQDLAVRLHPVRGFEVQGVSMAVVVSPRDGRRAIRTCKSNRRNKVSANDPADGSTGSAMFRMNLVQYREVSDDREAPLVSAVTVVDTRSTRFLSCSVHEGTLDATLRFDLSLQAALMLELQRVERRNAELVSSNRHLEAEFGGFKTYIRDTVLGYQRTIRQLPSELRQARGAADYG